MNVVPGIVYTIGYGNRDADGSACERVDDTDVLDKNRTHVLMITNHGVHEWNVVPGLPDTGGLDLAPLVAFIAVIAVRDYILPELYRAIVL